MVRTEWALGLNDGRSDEFSTENRRVDAAPGAVTRIQGDDFHYDGVVPRDDDFYTAGVYPQGFNGLPRRLDVPFDEPSSAWERALTKADPVNRIHLTLGRAQVADDSRFRIVWKYRAAGAVPTGAFERSTSVRLRGAFGEKDLGTVRRTGGLTEESLEFSFEGTSFEGGPVTLELRGNFPPDRTEAWTVFDFVRLELAPVPVFPPMGPVFATGGKHLTFTLQAELPGAENLGLVHELLKGPEGLTVTPTGVVDWTPPSARDWPVFPGDASVHWIQIGVRDPRNPQRLYPGPMTRIDVWEAILQAGTASDCELGEILVPIVGEGFKNMVALEGSLKWDPAVLTYRGTVTGDLAGTGELTGPPEAPDGVARFLWWTTATGDGVPDGQPLFHIRFAVTGPPGSSTSIQFETCRAYRDSGEPVAIVGREGAASGFCPVIGSGHVRYFGSALPVAGAEIHQGYGFSYSNAKLAFCRLETHRTTRTDTSGGFKVDLDSGTYDSHDPRKLWAGADVAEDTRTSGITMLDWLRLREHLLGLRPLTSAFSVVAADTHFDFIYDFYAGIVHGAYGAELPLDVLDLRRIARFVNGSLPPDDNPGWWPVGSWRMFPSSWGPDSIQHCYSDIGGSDPLNPYGHTVPVQNLWETEAGPQEWPGLDFVAVKVGDVNGSWGMEASAMATRSSGPALQVMAESVTATPGDVIRVALRTSAAERLTTAQFSIQWDPAVLEYVELGDLSLRGLGPESLGLGQVALGVLTLAWGDPEVTGVALPEGEQLLSLVFKVRGGPGTGTEVRLGGHPTPVELSRSGQAVPVILGNGFVGVTDPLRPTAGILAAAGNGGPTLWFDVPPGGGVIEQSADLVVWVPVHSVDSDGGLVRFTPAEGDGTHQFFRFQPGP